MNTQTKPQAETILVARGTLGGECRVQVSEDGWLVLEDTRPVPTGYLHYIDGISAAAITPACQQKLAEYFFKNRPSLRDVLLQNPRQQWLPALGATALSRYFSGLSRQDLENLGNGGKSIIYNG